MDEKLKGQGLATEALGRLQSELGVVAGQRYRLVADLVACIRRGENRPFNQLKNYTQHVYTA